MSYSAAPLSRLTREFLTASMDIQTLLKNLAEEKQTITNRSSGSFVCFKIDLSELGTGPQHAPQAHQAMGGKGAKANNERHKVGQQGIPISK